MREKKDLQKCSYLIGNAGCGSRGHCEGACATVSKQTYFELLLKSHPTVIDAGLASRFGSITQREDEGKLQNVASL